MSFNLPLNLNGTPINELGYEFKLTQETERDRGLIEPTIRDNINYNNFYTTEYISGIPNQSLILENNYNPSEELTMTNAQAQALIADQASLNRPLSVEEKEILLYTNNDLDPRINNQVIIESQERGENLDFSKSQDFVREIQESVKAYNDEQNLYINLIPYTQTPDQLKQDLNNLYNLSNDPLLSAYNTLEETYNILEQQRQAKLKERLKYVERPVAPQSEPTRGQKPQDEPIKPTMPINPFL